MGTSTDINPTYTFPDTGTYVITLTAEAPFTCPDVTTAEVEVQFLLEPTFNLPQPDCFDDHFFELTAQLPWMRTPSTNGTSVE